MGTKQKYIFVTGGVLSGVGKGITAASIGAILQAKGSKVSIQKCDPYLNVDAGLLNPREHGEVFVTHDGAETDLDLGHYERFLDIELTRKSTTLSGQLLSQLIADERAGKFNGQTVQLVPHLTDAIKQAIVGAGEGSDVHIVEIGGTVGDYEGLSFVEAIRDFAGEVGRENCMYVHIVYAPYLEASGEFKSKPAQNALNELRGFGITPDCVVVRSESPAPSAIAEKIARFSGLDEDAVVLLPNAKTVYEIPLTIYASGIGRVLNAFIGNTVEPDLTKWKQLATAQYAHYEQEVRVGVVAKYLDNEDTYLSIVEALRAASWQQKVALKIVWLNAEDATEDDFSGVDALLVPGGFGPRGIEGKIAAAVYALAHKTPYLGICLGLQAAAIAATRSAGRSEAQSQEVDPSTPHPVVIAIGNQADQEGAGGTQRLGVHSIALRKGSRVAKLYGTAIVNERHRHRYEVNRAYEKDIMTSGLVVSGTAEQGDHIEFIEASDHPYLIGTQSHPEFKSRPDRPHPLFAGLLQAAREAKLRTSDVV